MAKLWDLPAPHVIAMQVVDTDIDGYRHANNTVYLRWLDQAAWSHSTQLGLPIERCLPLDRGMAVVRTVIAYLRPALLGDVLSIGTWLLPGLSRLRIKRRFQIQRDRDGATLARAETEYACIVLSDGRPARWSRDFHGRYVPSPTTLELLPRLAPV